jgi:plasmid stabilization system protein ParE
MNKIADLWNDSLDRQTITNAVAEVDRLLADDPDQQGEDFYGDRLVFVDPLWVTFQVRPDDRIVQVLDVWHK